MRKEHRGRISTPDLQRVHVEIALKIINIQQQLGRFANSGNGLKRMAISQNRKISDSVQLEKIRTGNHKEIAHHQIRRPRAQQIGQAIENVISIDAFLRNNIVEPAKKKLSKPPFGIQDHKS